MFPGFDFNGSTMRFNNIVAQAESQSRSLTCWFGSEKRLKDLIEILFRNSIAVISYDNLYSSLNFLSAYGYLRRISVALHLFSFKNSVKCIIVQVQEQSSDFLRNDIQSFDGFIKRCNNLCVKAFVLRT